MVYSAVIIGSGFSGICMGIKLREKGIENFLILEKSDRVGGTWRENTYPGAECDIPSALYSFSFEPYPYWEYKWSHQDQIFNYLEQVVRKYKLESHIRYSHTFTKGKWLEHENCWEVSTQEGYFYKSKTLIPAMGQLHHPSVPPFEGKESFSGPYFHSAQWNHGVELKDKHIGVIGNAASAVQFIPEIAEDAKSITIFQRSANWMLPKQDRLYRNWEKQLVRKFPFLLKIYRTRIWLLSGLLYLLMQNKYHGLRRFYQNKCVRYIKKYIQDPDLVQVLTPSYPMGAKRVLFSDNYYQALALPHVKVITAPIQKIASQLIVTSQGSHELEVLIYATGFKTNPFLLGIELFGQNGLSIQEVWNNGHVNYLGITVPKFPNFFMLYGPNTNLGHSSIILMIEIQANYITRCIQTMEQSGWTSLTIKEKVAQGYFEKIQTRLQNMIWAQVGRSWYQSVRGDIPNNWPGRTMEYEKRVNEIDWAEFEIS